MSTEYNTNIIQDSNTYALPEWVVNFKDITKSLIDGFVDSIYVINFNVPLGTKHDTTKTTNYSSGVATHVGPVTMTIYSGEHMPKIEELLFENQPTEITFHRIMRVDKAYEAVETYKFLGVRMLSIRNYYANSLTASELQFSYTTYEREFAAFDQATTSKSGSSKSRFELVTGKAG